MSYIWDRFLEEVLAACVTIRAYDIDLGEYNQQVLLLASASPADLCRAFYEWLEKEGRLK